MRMGAPQRGHGHERVESPGGAVTGGGGATAKTVRHVARSWCDTEGPAGRSSGCERNVSGGGAGGSAGGIHRRRAFRVGRDLQQRRRRGAKQEIVHDARAGQREAGQRLRHREDEVDVAPTGRSSCSRAATHALRAAVRHLGQWRSPTAVVREGRLRTLVTAIGARRVPPFDTGQ